VLNALERLAGNYDGQLAVATRELAVARDQLRDFQGRIGKPFYHTGYMQELTDLRDQLKSGLSQRPPEGQVPVAELAERIKMPRSENAVEAAPVRKRVAARGVRPVTTRVREMVEPRETEVKAVPSAKPTPVGPPLAPVESPKPIEVPGPLVMQPMRRPDHRERVRQQARAMERQMRLFLELFPTEASVLE
jgi:hypothetical protein